MVSHEFMRNQYDSCVYFKTLLDGSFIYLLLYVDDMLIAAKNRAEINKLKQLLSSEFEMKDLGAAKKILGMEIWRDRDAAFNAAFHMDHSKPVSTPLAQHFKFDHSTLPSTDEEVEYMKCVPYSSVVGSLMCAMVCTRPILLLLIRYTGVVPHAKDIARSMDFTSSSLLTKTTKLCILALGTFPGYLSSKELERKWCLKFRRHPRGLKYFRNTKLSSPGCKVGFHLEGDFATLCKMLPSARSDWLVMAATSSFQLRIVHRLKHWIVDFLSFEMVYSMHHLDFRKCSKSGCYDCHQEYAP
ncbi:hypothetical protein AAG906_020434 [Vitis piasezkii]